MQDGPDPWAEWLLERRFGGDLAQARAVQKHHQTQRDRILENARVADGDVLLDVGCGDGLVGLGALAHTGDTGRVIFSDISQPLLDHCEAQARALDALHRCSFIRASATCLEAIASASVDVVTTRSVLIFAAEKQRAFEEFFRVLRPGGRLSIFEPVARFFGYPPPPHLFGWQALYDVTPIQEIAGKVQAIYTRVRSAESPMMDFDAESLVAFAEAAGFSEVTLELRAEVRLARPVKRWDTAWRRAPNPLAPTLAEAVAQALSEEETTQFVNHLRPLMESGTGQRRAAVAYLTAIK